MILKYKCGLQVQVQVQVYLDIDIIGMHFGSHTLGLLRTILEFILHSFSSFQISPILQSSLHILYPFLYNEFPSAPIRTAGTQSDGRIMFEPAFSSGYL